MHIEYLYYFRDFSKSLSISKTAAEYYMTPQGLSRALHQLEKDWLFGGFCGRDSGIGPAQRAKTTIWN